ncbi:MAG: FkbM family methyltransferase [Cyclobacteriaceae bacterium]
MKNIIFRNLPAGLLRKYFRWRGYCIDLLPEILSGVKVDLTINKDNELWISRLSQVEGHEPEICKWLALNLGEPEVIYDVGSHFGFFPAFISNLRPLSDIHTFQPYIYAFNFLRINQYQYRDRNRWSINEKFVSDQRSSNHITLDDYAMNNNWPTLIKIDIDGPEVYALRGCQKILEARKTRFLVEIHPQLMKDHFGHTWDDIFACIPKNYSFRYLPNVRTSAKWHCDFDAVADDDNPYIYFCPEEMNTDTF